MGACGRICNTQLAVSKYTKHKRVNCKSYYLSISSYVPCGQEFKCVVTAVSLSVVSCARRVMDTAITIPATLLFKAPLALFRLNPASQKRVSQLSPLVSNDMQTGCQPTSQILLMGVVEAGEILQLKRARKSLKIYNSVNNFSLSTCNICKIYFTVLSKYISK